MAMVHALVFQKKNILKTKISKYYLLLYNIYIPKSELIYIHVIIK